MEPKEVKLPSGASLQITLAPFADGRALFKAVTEEMKGLRLNPKDQVDVNFYKDLFCAALSSDKIEACVFKCAARALYNGERISVDTFEPPEARADYLHAMYEIALENLLPFGKHLYAEYAPILSKIISSLA